MTDATRDLIQGQSTDLLNQNVDGICQELSTSPDSKITVSFSFKLVRIGQKLHCDGCLSYSRKFKDEIEGLVELSDPGQKSLELQ